MPFQPLLPSPQHLRLLTFSPRLSDLHLGHDFDHGHLQALHSWLVGLKAGRRHVRRVEPQGRIHPRLFALVRLHHYLGSPSEEGDQDLVVRRRAGGRDGSGSSEHEQRVLASRERTSSSSSSETLSDRADLRLAQPMSIITASEDDNSPVIMLWDLKNSLAPQKVRASFWITVCSCS